jgi:ABC-2 type transport system permease protein
MKLRTSFFNPTVFFKDITRYFPVWGLYLIGGGLTLMTSMLALLTLDDTFAGGVLSNIQAMSFVNMIYAIISAQLLFGDLFKARHCNMLHAMPLRREAWFTTHFLAGLLFSFVPNLLLSLPITLFCGWHWYFGLVWLVSADLQYLFFFSTAVFAVMCAGKKFASTAVYLLLHFLSYIIYWFLSVFYIPLLPGIVLNGKLFALFCPVIRLCNTPVLDYTSDYVSVNPNYPYGEHHTVVTINGLGPNFWYLLVLGALGLVFAVVSLLMYRKRRLESAGDFVSARPLAPVFSLFFTLCVGAICHMIFGGIVLFLPIGLAVGYFAGQMLLQRKVNVFQLRRFASFGIITVAVLLSMAITWLDPLGITRYVPKAQKIQSVTVSNSYIPGFELMFSNPDYMYGMPDKYTTDDPEQIEKIVDVHKSVVKQTTSPIKKLLSPFFFQDTVSLWVTYTMENGYEIQRRYEVPVDTDAGNAVTDFCSSPEFVLGYDDWDTYLKSVSYVEIGEYSLYGTQKKELLLAMKADCEMGRMGSYYNSSYKGDVYIRMDEDWKYITVNDDCLYTVSWLNKHCPGWDY